MQPVLDYVRPGARRARSRVVYAALLVLLIFAIPISGWMYYRHTRVITVDKLRQGFGSYAWKGFAPQNGADVTAGKQGDLCLVIILSRGAAVEYAHIDAMATPRELPLLSGNAPVSVDNGGTFQLRRVDLTRFIENACPDWTHAEAQRWLESVFQTFAENPDAATVIQRFRDRDLFADYKSESNQLKVGIDARRVGKIR